MRVIQRRLIPTRLAGGAGANVSVLAGVSARDECAVAAVAQVGEVDNPTRTLRSADRRTSQ